MVTICLSKLSLVSVIRYDAMAIASAPWIMIIGWIAMSIYFLVVLSITVHLCGVQLVTDRYQLFDISLCSLSETILLDLYLVNSDNHLTVCWQHCDDLFSSWASRTKGEKIHRKTLRCREKRSECAHLLFTWVSITMNIVSFLTLLIGVTSTGQLTLREFSGRRILPFVIYSLYSLCPLFAVRLRMYRYIWTHTSTKAHSRRTIGKV